MGSQCVRQFVLLRGGNICARGGCAEPRSPLRAGDPTKQRRRCRCRRAANYGRRRRFGAAGTLDTDTAFRGTNQPAGRACCGDGWFPFTCAASSRTMSPCAFERSASLLGNATCAVRRVASSHPSAVHGGALVDRSAGWTSRSCSSSSCTLKEMGFEFLTFGDLVHRVMAWGSPKNNVACLTFDDGFQATITMLRPLGESLDASGTFFVTTGLMVCATRPSSIAFARCADARATYLSAVQVADYTVSLSLLSSLSLSLLSFFSSLLCLFRAGFEIGGGGGHTHTHPNLGRLAGERRDGKSRIAKCCWNRRSPTVQRTANACGAARVRLPVRKRHIHYTGKTVNLLPGCASWATGAASVAFRGRG